MSKQGTKSRDPGPLWGRCLSPVHQFFCIVLSVPQEMIRTEGLEQYTEGWIGSPHSCMLISTHRATLLTTYFQAELVLHCNSSLAKVFPSLQTATIPFKHALCQHVPSHAWIVPKIQTSSDWKQLTRPLYLGIN